MKKKIAGLLIGFLLIGTDLFAADGDLIVNGNVGIGVQSSAVPLYVFGSAIPQAIVENASGNARLDVRRGSSTAVSQMLFGTGAAAEYQLGMFSDSNFQLRSVPDSTKGITLTPSGSVGVGTTAPTAKLHVFEGDITASRSDANTVFLTLHQQSAGNDGKWLFASRSGKNLGFTTYTRASGGQSDVMLLTYDGKVGLGMSPWDLPTYQLHLSTNSAFKPSSSTWQYISDERVKKDIRPFEEGLETLLKIRPIWYKFNGKAGFKDEGKDYIGVSAQEIKDIAPYTVDKHKAKLNEGDEQETELYNFDAHALTFILINAVKEQQKIIEALQKDIDELKKMKQ